jgi:outer membrane protein TolC
MNAIGLSAAVLLAQAAPGAKLITFDDALREAQERSLDLQAARARLEQARTLGWKAWSAHLPQITAGASWTHNNAAAVVPFGVGQPFIRDMGSPQGPAAGGSVPGAPTNYAIQYEFGVQDITLQKQDQLGAQVQGTMALVAPSLWFGIAAASQGEKQAEQGFEAVRRDILLGAAQLYYGAVGGKNAVRITERQLAIALDHEKDARVRYQAGTAPKVALLRAEIDRAKAEQDRKAAQAGYDSARVALATLLARPEADFDVEAPAEQPAPGDATELEETAPRDRPDVQAAATAVKVADRTRGSVWAQYLPSLGAFARWQWANLGGFTGREDSWAVGLALNWTLLDGTLREAQLADTRARTAEAEANLKGAEIRARSEVRRAKLALDAAVANRDKAKETVDLARENQRLVDVSYKAGAATYIEVADANNQLLTAELGSVAEDLTARLALLQLLKAAGRFP